MFLIWGLSIWITPLHRLILLSENSRCYENFFWVALGLMVSISMKFNIIFCLCNLNIEFESKDSDLTAKSVVKLSLIYNNIIWKQIKNIKMSLQIEYERPYQGIEPESSQNININFVR